MPRWVTAHRPQSQQITADLGSDARSVSGYITPHNVHKTLKRFIDIVPPKLFVAVSAVEQMLRFKFLAGICL